MAERKPGISRRALGRVLFATGASLLLPGCGRPRPEISRWPGGTGAEDTGSAVPVASPTSSGIRAEFTQATPEAYDPPSSGVLPTIESVTSPGSTATGGTEVLPPSSEYVRIENGYIWFDMRLYTNDTCTPPGDIPQELAREIVLQFGTGIEAIQAVAVAWSENISFDPYAQGSNGNSVDIGYFQINSGNLGALAEHLGIHSIEELTDAHLNVAAARYLYDKAGGLWTPWYGPLRVDCPVPR